MSKETRTRGVLKRAKKNYRKNPTPGRQQAIEKYEQHLTEQEYLRLTRCLPCPCCGNINLYIGSMSSDSLGVHCQSGEELVSLVLIRQGRISLDDIHLQGCGLQLSVPIPNDYPEDFPKFLRGRDAVEHLRRLALYEAVRRWNCRGTYAESGKKKPV